MHWHGWISSRRGHAESSDRDPVGAEYVVGGRLGLAGAAAAWGTTAAAVVARLVVVVVGCVVAVGRLVVVVVVEVVVVVVVVLGLVATGGSGSDLGVETRTGG